MGWCFNCGEKIFFDDNIRNGYGMVIPLDDNGNLTVAGTIIEKQVLVKIKNVLDVEKISSLMKLYVNFRGNITPGLGNW